MHELWTAADAVIAELCVSPVIQRHAHVMSTWRRRDAPHVAARVLHETFVADQFEQKPLLMGWVIGFEGVDGILNGTPEGAEWVRGARAVATGFGRIIEWWRSALPGYPMLMVPHLDVRANRSQPASYFRGPTTPWLPDLRREAPQLQNQPNIAPLQPLDGGRALVLASRQLRASLALTEQWREFDAAARALDADARGMLKALRDEHRHEISDDRVDRIDPENLVRRHRYKEAVLADLIAATSGPARAYLDAFTAVDELIAAVVRIVENGVVFGPPRQIGTVVEGVWRRAPYGQRVRLVTSSDDLGFGAAPMIVEVTAEVAFLEGVVLGDRLTVNVPDMSGPASSSLEGLLLPHSLGTLHAGPAA
jgi:hypothetical protein